MMPGKQGVPRLSEAERRRAIEYIERFVGQELRSAKRGDAVGFEMKLIAEAFARVTNDSVGEGTILSPQPDLSRVA